MKKKLMACILASLMCLQSVSPVLAEEWSQTGETETTESLSVTFEDTSDPISEATISDSDDPEAVLSENEIPNDPSEISVDETADNFSDDPAEVSLQEEPDSSLESSELSSLEEESEDENIPAVGDSVTSDGFQYTTSGLTATITKYTGTASTVTIPSKINNYTVIKVDSNAFLNNLSVTSVIFSSGITEIGAYAFSGCTALEKITLPSSLKTLGAGFISGTSVTSLTIPADLTSCSTSSGGGPLSGAEKLTSLTLKSGMEKIPDNLAYCAADTSHLTSVSIPDTVTSIGYRAFNNCLKLPSVSLPANLQTIGSYAFSSCRSLEKITLPKTVTSVGTYAFSNCSGLSSLVFTENTKTGFTLSVNGYAFSGCTSLYDITFSKNITLLDYDSFSNCSSLTSLVLPDSITEIGGYAFYKCTALEKITLPSRLKTLGAGFISGTPVTSLTIPADLTTCSSNTSGGPLADAEKLTSLTIESGMEKIPDNLAYCVADTSHLTSVSIPDTVTSIGQRAFNNCLKLPSVSLPANLQTIGSNAFSSCRSLEKITLPKTVTTVNTYAFSNCSGLSSLVFTENPKTGFTLSVKSYAFSSCTSLCDITFSKNITLLDYDSFSFCSSLTSLVLPDSITEIGSSAFYKCTALEKITLPSGLKKLGAGFISGTPVTSLTIPAGLTYCSYSSSGGPLEGAEKLTTLTIESGMEKIPDHLAYYASHLTTVSIPNTVTSIGNSAFSYCPLLGETNIPGSVTSIADNAFNGWKNLVIKGISGTAAETYATEKGIPFKESIQEGTWILAGRLDGVDTSNRTIDLEERVYTVSSDFNINTASNIMKNSNDKIVVFTCSDGKITHMEAAEDIIQASISLVKQGLGSDDFTYENGQYSGALSYYVKLKCAINPNSSYSLSEIRQLLPSYTVSVAGIQVTPGPHLTAHFTDMDSNFLTGEFINPVKLGLNNYKNVATVVFNVASSFVPEKAKTELSATFSARLENHTSYTVTGSLARFTLTNKDYYRQQAEKKKEQSEREQNIKKAQNMLTNNNILSFPADLNDYFTTQQLEELRAFLSGYVATVINSSSFSYTGDQSNSASKKVLEKLFSKMGLNEKTILLAKTLNGSFSVSATTKKGARTINFSFSISNYGLGNTGFGAMGGLNYSISQDNKSGYIPVVSANASALAQQMKSIAEDAVKNAYNETWGKHADEVAEILFTKTVTDLIGKTKMGSFSNCVYTMFTKPAASTNPSRRRTTAKIHCPVDVYVYDLNHDLCGAIVNNVVDTTYDELDMYVDGDEKFISFYESDYYLKLVGNDTGTMTYEIEEYVDNQLTRRLSYNDIPLTNGKTYNSYVPGNQNLEAGVYSPTDESDNKIETSLDSKPAAPERISAESIQLDQTTKSLKVGESFTLVPAVSPVNATIKDVFWTSDNETVATVDSNGTVTARSAGSSIITAHTFDGDFTAACTLTVTSQPAPTTTPEKDHNWSSWKTTKEATVLAAGQKQRTCSTCGKTENISLPRLNPTFKLSMTSIVLKKGQTTNAFKVTGLARGDRVKSYASVNKKIATISSTGKIKGKKTGTTKIIVTLESGKQISVKIKVQKKPVATSKIMVASSRISLSPKKKYKLTVSRTPLTTVEKITYKSSNTKIASVNAKGVITGKKKGTATITIRSGKKKKTVKVTVK